MMPLKHFAVQVSIGYGSTIAFSSQGQRITPKDRELVSAWLNRKSQ